MLSGQQRRQLLGALIDAFPSKSSLEQMLSFEFNRNLNAIAGGGNLQEIVFRLIQTAEAEGWLEDLIRAAREVNPGNPRLLGIAEAYITSNSHSLTADLSSKAIVEGTLKTQSAIRELIEKSYSQGENTLDLSNQGIEELPPEIGQLTNLKELDLSGNTLTKLPIEIGQLTNLEVLKLSGNRLTRLPKSLVRIQKLTILDLSNNQLSAVPVEITTLKHLKGLNLTANYLVDLPVEIGNLVNLNTFYLSENRLSQLPVHFGSLKQLTSLDISRNQFDTLPAEVSYLTNLRELIVSGNRLTDLPSNLNELIYLKELDLSRNRLSSVPSVVIQLTSLDSLNLGNNALTDLPDNLVNLTNLTSINLQGNPFTELPESFTRIIEPSRIFSFLTERAKSEEKPLSEAKLLIVGEADVGKTSLINRLVYNIYNPNENITKGISIVPWEIAVSSARVKINIWDFGGQEIMHATHQFFLTKRSIYALVLDSRRGEHESRLEYWLKLIRSFGGDSPILVICNKADQSQVDLDWTGLNRKYGIYAYARAVSCKTGQGIDEIKKFLAEVITKLKHINDPLPANWIVVKSKLQNMKEDYISYERYEKISKLSGIKDRVIQENLLQYLHDLGVVLWFGEDPRLNNINVLNPEWVTRAIYQILNSNLAFQQKGRLKIHQLEEILDLQKYPKTKYTFIIDMMKRFELCFSFENYQEETVLIPDLLQKDEPYTGDWNESLLFQIHYDVLPGSIISRFIVRMHHYALKETYWRNGIVLENKDSGTKALVRADSIERKIFIKLVGQLNARRRFLEVIRSHFRAIHESISNLGASEWVPVPKTDAVLSYESLLKNEEHGIDKLIPPNMNEPVSVSKLLDGVDPPEKRLKESYFGTRGFETPVPVKLRELLSDLVDKLIAIPSADSFEGRTALLLSIPNSDSLNRSTINARTDISLLVQQLRERDNQFSQDHPLHIFIDNAWQYVKGSPLGQDLVSLRDRIKEVFEELYNDQH